MIRDRPNKKYRPFRNRISYNTAINQDLKRLEAHDWPGNVREPENVIMGVFLSGKVFRFNKSQGDVILVRNLRFMRQRPLY